MSTSSWEKCDRMGSDTIVVGKSRGCDALTFSFSFSVIFGII